MAFPENHHGSSNIVTSTVAAGWKTIKGFFTGRREKDSQFKLEIPTNQEIRQTSLSIYLETFERILLTSNYNAVMPIHQCVEEICHIFNSLSKVPITTSPTLCSPTNVVIHDKHIYAMKKVMAF